MRLFSNVRLPWASILHIHSLSRCYAGPCANYHIFHVKSVNPTVILSASPITLLSKNRPYYFYENCFEKHINLRNIRDVMDNQWVYLPNNCISGDIINIYEDEHSSSQLLLGSQFA
jgi:hypothetical protein